VPGGRFVIEQAPVPDNDGAKRGVVAGGAVGSRWAGRLRIFRYELRRWRDGVIPDIAEAVESPQLLTTDPRCAQRVLDLAPSVPTLVWGRDQLAAGRCGTPTPSSHGCSSAAASTLNRSIHRPADEHQAGTQASSSHAANSSCSSYSGAMMCHRSASPTAHFGAGVARLLASPVPARASQKATFKRRCRRPWHRRPEAAATG
jgi:hypothetical protein